MEEFVIETGIPFLPIRSGRKKGVRQFDNQALVHEAALGVINKKYESNTEAAKVLMGGFKTNSGEERSIITMFRKAISAEIMKLNCEAKHDNEI